jgi:hypothetical protein
MVYSEKVTFTMTSGALASYVFSGNGLYDPNITGTGHQPYGYDLYNVLYRRYVVHSSNIKATFMLTPGVEQVCMCCLETRPYTPVGNEPTFIGACVERPRAVSGVCTELIPVTLRTGGNTTDMTGVPESQQRSNPDVYSYSSTVPTTQWYHVLFAEAQPAGANLSVTALVTIEYDATFFDRIQQGTS